ncbi:HlyD family secretion protein [Dethiosulfatibacter aminovorans DSM 17477]|uniref:HlyD family secretion protein n=1 Tax=Dethiosulfatibacter aminovorans DSM 17477 TaxID=1121476 RepID=A0A1M6GM40_9FIRM|nr:HlyD family efflux transporter periplasmic adaptor subunit [Dethiosulfatibacter aminovorans]SHJ11029.1 HlyD family secretion protein [Dethiosulfatibacter aminovorans DSM 17477]
MIKKIIARLVVLGIIAAVIFGFYKYYKIKTTVNESMYYGELQWDTFDVVSPVPGMITEINIYEGELVEAESEVAMLDDSKMVLQREQARISKDIAEQNIDKSVTGASEEEINIQNQTIKQLESQKEALESNIDGAWNLYEKSKIVSDSLKSTYDFNTANYDKIKALYDEDIETQVNLDNAVLAMTNSKNAYDSALVDTTKVLNDIDTLKFQVEAVDAQIIAAKERLARLEKGYDDPDKNITALNDELADIGEKIVERNLEDYHIVAKRSGTVESIYYSIGEFLNTGSPIATLYDSSKGYVTIYISEKDLLKIDMGQELKLTLVADKSIAMKGIVRKIDNEAMFTPVNIVTEENRERLVFKVEIDIEKVDKLKAGMLISVDLSELE